MFEKLKNGILKKYENKNYSKSNTINNQCETSSCISQSVKSEKHNRKNESINQLKKLHNKLEHNYILFLKNISKVILTSKDLIRKPDPNLFCNKIK